MRIGPLQLQLSQLKDGSWRYRVTNERDPDQYTEGFRPSEHAARDAGLEDAYLMRQFA